ncbi:MAG: hypothetical protein JWN64_586 [Parcubacteria group bacterium]|nr:hypothetical protein [Parcubacteria group bacterium]
MDQNPEAPVVRTSYGSVLSIVVLLIVIVAGAAYMWHKRATENTEVIPVTQTEDTQTDTGEEDTTVNARATSTYPI